MHAQTCLPFPLVGVGAVSDQEAVVQEVAELQAVTAVGKAAAHLPTPKVHKVWAQPVILPVQKLRQVSQHQVRQVGIRLHPPIWLAPKSQNVILEKVMA